MAKLSAQFVTIGYPINSLWQTGKNYILDKVFFKEELMVNYKIEPGKIIIEN